MTCKPDLADTQFWGVYAHRVLGDNNRLIMSTPSAYDILGRITLFVTCDKHNTMAEVKYASSDKLADIELLKAAQSCKKCQEEQTVVLPPTKWPEGAEL